MLSEEDRQALIVLQWHWDGYYKIAVADGVWRAQRLDQPARFITADSARELRQMMKDDYAELVTARHQDARHAEGGSL
jgi:hypothetical protein